MAPISELRGAIPLGIIKYHLSWQKVFLTAFLGNITAVVFLLIFLASVSEFFKKNIGLFNKLWSWLLKTTYKRNKKRFEIFGSLALITLVAIPLPLTGAWTGVLASFVFQVRFRTALALISLGVLISGIIVTLLTLSIV